MSLDYWLVYDDEPWDPTPEMDELGIIEAVSDFWFLIKPEPWMEDAACKGKTDLYFLQPGQNSRQAKRICETCAVVEPCREYAAATGSEGIWAGEVRSGTNPSTVQDARPQVITIEPRHTKDAAQHHGFGAIAARRQTGT